MRAPLAMHFSFREFVIVLLPCACNRQFAPETGFRSRSRLRASTSMIPYRTFTGGIFETNCYALEAPQGWILFDAPDGACDWLVKQRIELKLLLLTHGHIDHIQDVAKIKRRFGCPVGIHPESTPMISERDFFRDFGFGFEIEPVQPDVLIEATLARDFLGMTFEILEVPGHCQGSLCFFSRANELLIGGVMLLAP